MKYLKKRKDSDALYYQRRIHKYLIAKAAKFNLSSPITRPLNLSASQATDIQIATKLEQRNKEFEDLMRLVESTDLRAMSNAEWEQTARAYLDARGLKGGTLRGVEFGSDEFDYRTAANSGWNKEKLGARLFEQIELAVMRRFPKLKLYDAWGIQAQNLEGAMLRHVMLQGIEKDIVCLPVHDAIAVPQQHEKWAVDVMLEAWERFGVRNASSARARVKVDRPETRH